MPVNLNFTISLGQSMIHSGHLNRIFLFSSNVMRGCFVFIKNTCERTEHTCIHDISTFYANAMFVASWRLGTLWIHSFASKMLYPSACKIRVLHTGLINHLPPCIIETDGWPGWIDGCFGTMATDLRKETESWKKTFGGEIGQCGVGQYILFAHPLNIPLE